jgi:cobalt-zinc-cadmium efflux system protein
MFLIYEAVPRFFAPTKVGGWIVIIVAGIALVIDVATAALTYRMAKGELNVKAAFVHNVADALASVGVIIAGLLIIYFDWYLADPIIAVGISAYILYQGVTGMRPAIRILMDAVPEGVSLHEVVEAIENSEGVASAHHVHLRSLSEHRRSLTAHVVVTDAVRTVKQLEDVKIAVRARLADEFEIQDVTLEFEVEGDAAEAGEVKTVVPPD